MEKRSLDDVGEIWSPRMPIMSLETREIVKRETEIHLNKSGERREDQTRVDKMSHTKSMGRLLPLGPSFTGPDKDHQTKLHVYGQGKE